MNRNIDEYAHRFYSNPGENPAGPVEQIRARVVKRDRFEALRIEQPDWYELGDGINNLSGVDENGIPFAYKLAVRKTPDEWFFLAYDMTQTVRGEERFNRRSEEHTSELQSLKRFSYAVVCLTKKKT